MPTLSAPSAMAHITPVPALCGGTTRLAESRSQSSPFAHNVTIQIVKEHSSPTHDAVARGRRHGIERTTTLRNGHHEEAKAAHSLRETNGPSAFVHCSYRRDRRTLPGQGPHVGPRTSPWRGLTATIGDVNGERAASRARYDLHGQEPARPSRPNRRHRRVAERRAKRELPDLGPE